MAQRHENRWKSKFARFVQSYGVNDLARELDVHSTAIYQWVRGLTRPKPECASAIQRLAGEHGTRLTLDQIYGHARDLRAVDPAVIVSIQNRKTQRATMAAASRKR